MSISRPARVLVTTDLTDASLAAMPYAIALARRHGARLDVVHVVIEYVDLATPFPEGPVLDMHVEHVAKEADRLLTALDLGNTSGVDVHRHAIRSGSAARGITEAARTFESDVIVTASHGRRLLAQLMLGSVARNVIAAAPCPVLCVKSREHGMLDPETGELRLRHVLVGTDLSEASAKALEVARDLAAVHDGSVEVTYVAHVELPATHLGVGVGGVFQLDPELEPRIRRSVERFVETHGAPLPRVRVHVEEGCVSKRLAARADETDADLIVLTRTGEGGSPHLLGGIPERLLHDAHCPVLVV